jgi:hypothetical protein
MKNDLTKERIVELKISKMEPGDYFNVKEFVNSHWMNGYDIWSKKSFSVILQRAKNKLPNKQFRTIKGNLTRIK